MFNLEMGNEISSRENQDIYIHCLMLYHPYHISLLLQGMLILHSDQSKKFDVLISRVDYVT
ncbi:hypothetical protein SAMN05428978_103114 [Nitrosomonas sp. Nm34]|nr:hypothetical protein SAMN05428978_103114 [Nitrosomonas sp. Nm34]